jgi:hypothetical protein
MSTPAPSLEDMPPEKGTILQLHSIDAKWDGKLVEFLGPVKDNGKYLVQSFDGEEENMTVKPKVCKQPGIQPLAMRVVLYNISRTFIIEAQESDFATMVQQKKTVEEQILPKDPCCVAAHYCTSCI